MKHLVLYHANCMDGLAAACVAAKYVFQDLHASDGDVEFRPVQYGSPAPLDEAKGAAVYVLDFAYPVEDMIALFLDSPSFYWVDHHNDELRHTVNGRLERTAAEHNVFVAKRFSTADSGATATWKLLFGGSSPMPEVLRYVQDRDLWTWALPQSREVSAALDLEYRGADVADRWQYFLGETIENLVMDGTILLRHQALRVAASVKSARPWPHTTIGDASLPEDTVVMIVNSPQDISEVGDALCEAGADLAVMFFQTAKGHWVYSLRSRPSERYPEGVDCREIAGPNGGGGHRNAAGFQSSELLA